MRPSAKRKLAAAAVVLFSAATAIAFWRASDVNAVYKGGTKEETWSHTPAFQLDRDSPIEIEINGTISRATLVVGPHYNDGLELELIDPRHPENLITWSTATGGEYWIVFFGSGDWTVTIKRGESEANRNALERHWEWFSRWFR